MKWSFVGDLQIPYHDARAVALYIKAMKWWKPDAIDFVGDIDDQLEYSQFSDGTTDEFLYQQELAYKSGEKAIAEYYKEVELIHKEHERNVALQQKEYEKELAAWVKQNDSTDPRLRFLLPPKPQKPVALEKPEIPESPLTLPERINPIPLVKENAQGAKEFYSAMRQQHKNADMHSSLGNHDIRVFKYIDKKAPDYIDLVTPNLLWGLDDLGITWKMYSERPFERYAGIHVHHGTTSIATGLAVRQDIENFDISLVRGHDHRGGVVYKTRYMSGNSLVGMGCGHLCNPDAYGLAYADNPSWEQGFGIAHVDGGKAHLQFIPIRNTDEGYVLFLDGKKFVG